MDHLERFIIEHRSEFDDLRPPAKSWDAVSKGLLKHKPAKRIALKWYALRAAMIAGLLLVGVWVGMHFNGSANTQLAGITNDPEFREMQNYYDDQINTKLAKLTRYNEHQYVEQDLKGIDSAFNELKKELDDIPKGSEEMVMHAMIKNYQTKIEILERVLQELEHKNLKNQEDEISI